MKLARPILLTVLSLGPLAAQTNRDDLTPLEITYTTEVSNDLRSLRITMEVGNLRRPFTHVAMPNWTPGAYGIGRYGGRVQDLSAVGGSGASLEVTRMDFQTWSVDPDGQDRMRVSYSLPAPRGRGRRGAAAEPEGPVTGFQVRGPSSYIYVRGAKDVPVEARYVVPDNWRVANGLLTGENPLVRRARDFDTFIDAPTIYGIFVDYQFEVNGTPFTCVFFENSQTYDFDIEGFVEVCRKIAAYQGEFYGSYPFPNYVFLFTLPGGGGLEHLNSTSIGLNPQRMKLDVTAGASVTSHEFFHTWNVKRIRPVVLGPFEYEHENYTGNLWVSEGWTSYFGDLTLLRTGIIDRSAFLQLFERYIGREYNKQARLEHSVYWASRNVWHRGEGASPRVDYYATGEILGALIDLKIRHETDNKKSLDDVMRFLNRWFAERGVGFQEGDIERACTAISNYDFGEFFARYVFGTMDPPFAEYFGYAGILYEETLEDESMTPHLSLLEDIGERESRVRQGWLTGR